MYSIFAQAGIITAGLSLLPLCTCRALCHVNSLCPLFCQQFVKFANIEEDTPSYHRSYDFFVSRFSEMCHSEHEDADIQNK